MKTSDPWYKAFSPRLATCLVASSTMLLAAGCGLSYPGDRQQWSLATTPNAVAGASIEGELVLVEPSDDLPSARLYEHVEKAGTTGLDDVEMFVTWEGDWEFDGEKLHLELDCTSEESQNHPGVDCANTKLELHCTLDERAGRSTLACGRYAFD